ncbi:MAG: preprotein translocase subunit YajC [Thermodesulfobacteriota bacterium]
MVNWAYAAGAGGAGDAGSMWTAVLPLILMVGIFYFLLIRPQQKKAKEHRQFLENLKKGDRVITSGGICGEVTSISEQTIIMEVADKVRVEVGRPYIAGFAPKK